MTTTEFAAFFEKHDPWGLKSLWYEARKRDLMMAALPETRYRSALEAGCANGMLTERLAERCDALVAVDLVPRAIERTRDRLGALDRVEARVARLPAEWPAGRFDLIVLSELGYFFSREAWDATVTCARNSLSHDGTIIACHWLRPFAERQISTRHVHAAIGGQRGLHRHVRHVEPDFLLEVWSLNAKSLRMREPA